MKRLLFIILASAVFLPLAGASAATDPVSLRGRILLQTQAKGQAWYVLPENGMRVYLGRPEDAFALMQRLSMGISNADLAKIPLSGEAQSKASIAKRVSGRVLLQVEAQGQTWYVNPVNLKRYYFGRSADLFKLMQELSLGISNRDLEKIPVDTRYPMPPTIVSANQYDVVMYNYAFTPKNLSIRVGDTVNWTNQDPSPHTVTPVTKLDGFGSGSILAGQTYSFKFTKKGTYSYKCSLHPGMTGTVTVK